eukprot:CAMPEP_0175215102 /NCGR_PEP_ID=MMETSP0093-20121207/17044_1 /TAXON_ID=311494 /ORGANISM="Alexandrium monilatum, Strain CCMP3105" /LENGTH=324 /DNA_ID=CAMNT_0016508465 /DNA_START=14 /DNA_END=987 /DNA_ORIENTATION=+
MGPSPAQPGHAPPVRGASRGPRPEAAPPGTSALGPPRPRPRAPAGPAGVAGARNASGGAPVRRIGAFAGAPGPAAAPALAAQLVVGAGAVAEETMIALASSSSGNASATSMSTQDDATDEISQLTQLSAASAREGQSSTGRDCSAGRSSPARAGSLHAGTSFGGLANFSVSHTSQVFMRLQLRNVQAGQLHCAPSASAGPAGSRSHSSLASALASSSAGRLQGSRRTLLRDCCLQSPAPASGQSSQFNCGWSDRSLGLHGLTGVGEGPSRAGSFFLGTTEGGFALHMASAWPEVNMPSAEAIGHCKDPLGMLGGRLDDSPGSAG